MLVMLVIEQPLSSIFPLVQQDIICSTDIRRTPRRYRGYCQSREYGYADGRAPGCLWGVEVVRDSIIVKCENDSIGQSVQVVPVRPDELIPSREIPPTL